MGQVDALKMADHIRTRLVDLAVAENYVRDRDLSNAFREIWSRGGTDGGLVSELWVEGAFPGEQTSDTLERLATQGQFPEGLCTHIGQTGMFPRDRALYNHQSEAIRTCAASKKGDRPPLSSQPEQGSARQRHSCCPCLQTYGMHPQGTGMAVSGASSSIR